MVSSFLARGMMANSVAKWESGRCLRRVGMRDEGWRMGIQAKKCGCKANWRMAIGMAVGTYGGKAVQYGSGNGVGLSVVGGWSRE